MSSIISSRNDKPYAHRKKLRLCFAGSITASRSDASVKCHRMAVKDISFEKMAYHHFVLDDKPKIEDVGIKEMLEPMYFSEFCEGNNLQMNSILSNIKEKTEIFLIFWKQVQRRWGHIMKYLCLQGYWCSTI